MNKTTTQLDRASLSDSTFWWCQLGGWSAFVLFEFLLVLGLRGSQTHILILAENMFLVGLQGIVTTQLLHVYARRHGWLQLPSTKLWIRLVISILSLGAILTWLGLLTHRVVAHIAFSQVVDLRDLSLRWLLQTFGLVIWTILYVALHQLQWRRAAEGRALRLEMVAQEAQLRGLRAQLNPHFFFNCLNNLRELIAQDPDRAQRMVTQLAGLLRYSLQADRVELVSLADEIRVVEDYLALEVTRFEERLRVCWDVAPDAETARVPPMLLQTLVENAVKHGIAERPQGGAIAISARVVNLQMELQVLNSGEVRKDSSSKGIGLRNAQDRLMLLYGQRANLVVQNTSDGWVRALVTLPLDPVEVTP